MNRSIYYNYVEEKIITLGVRVENRGKLNILDLHLHSENFYLNLLNHLYGRNLENLNDDLQNVEAIDLIDKKNKYIIQVSATCTKAKIEKSLSKDIIELYCKDGYSFKFISISKDASDLRDKTYENPFGIKFDSKNDIYDINRILKYFFNIKEVNKQKEICKFIKEELGNDLDTLKMNSNITMIINILSEENLSIINNNIEVSPFEIKRKIDFNNLIYSEDKINDYKIYHSKINEIYEECNKTGVNKSISILNKINSCYLNLANKFSNNDELFNKITEDLIDIVLKSSNYKEISYEELLLAIDILVVDSFIRCKIFKNPNNYNYAPTR